MRVVIDVDTATTRVEHADVYTTLDVFATGTTEHSLAPLDTLLRRDLLGSADDEHARLAIDLLRSYAVSAADFDAMIEYASTKGWVDPGAGTVRAHIVWGTR